MLARLKALFSDDAQPADGSAQDGIGEVEIAAAALLVESALMDGHFDAGERSKIAQLLGKRFSLGAAAADKLIETAEARVTRSPQLYGFTRVVKDEFEYEERIELIEMLWEVAYADGELHDFEASLMRRVAGLIYVSDQDSGAARRRVLERRDSAAETEADSGS